MYETEAHKSHRNISFRNIHHQHGDHVVVHYETRIPLENGRLCKSAASTIGRILDRPF